MLCEYRYRGSTAVASSRACEPTASTPDPYIRESCSDACAQVTGTSAGRAGNRRICGDYRGDAGCLPSAESSRRPPRSA